MLEYLEYFKENHNFWDGIENYSQNKKDIFLLALLNGVLLSLDPSLSARNEENNNEQDDKVQKRMDL